MDVSDIVDKLRLDIGDLPMKLLKDSGSDSGEEYLIRAVEKTAVYLNRDLGTGFTIASDAVSPDPSGQQLEAYLLRAHMFVCVIMRTVAIPRAMRNKSENKEYDKIKQPKYWEELEESLMKQYKNWVKALNPDSDLLVDERIIKTMPFGRVYEHGVRDESGEYKVDPGYPTT